MTDLPLKSPYPWFGGKARIATEVWKRFGGIRNYVEPFFGGGAVLLARPGWQPGALWTETVNDINAWLCNFWRAVQHDPDAVARYAADPVSELDLHARGDWLFYRPGVDAEFIERLRGDPDWYDAQSAGWWVWGQSSWIGDNWGRRECRARPHLGAGNGVNRQLPHLGDAGTGVNRQLPHLGDAGTGVNRQLPHLGAGKGVNRKLPHLGAGKGVNRKLPAEPEPDITTRHAGIRDYMRQLCERMARVRVCCGDWSRVLGPTPTEKLGLTAVFLDPPYGVADRDECYGEHDSLDVAADVRAWCVANGDNPMLRIALCGYEGEHAMPDTWECLAWKAKGGYANQRKNGANVNATRERVWFSPHCLGVEREQTLFGNAAQKDVKR